MKDPLPHWTILLILTAVTLILTAVYLQNLLAVTGGRWGVPLDDAWIHFQFARNLAQGNGFSFNPGDPQPGSTAPLWTLLLAGVGLFTEEFLIPAITLSTLFLLATVWLGYGFAWHLTTSRLAAFLAGLGIGMTGRMLWAGLSGMEVTAFAALSVGAVWSYSRAGLRPWTALLFALASQIRPEGHALFALAVIDTGYEWLMVNGKLLMVNWMEGIRRFLPPILTYILVSLPYSLFSLSVTGQPLPNTFYAKVGSEHFFSVRTLRETMALHWGDNPIALILVVVGLWPTWKRSRLTVLWLLGLWLLTPIIIDQVWHHGRYTMPLIPFQMIVAAVGANWIFSVSSKQWSVSSKYNLITVYCSLFTLLLVLGAAWRFAFWRDMLATNANEILEIDVALGEWLAENTSENGLIALDDIGAITFLSQRQIVDMNGLVSPQVWPAVRQPIGLLRDTQLTRTLSQSRPDYVVAFPLWHFELTRNAAVLTPVHKVTTNSHTIIFQPEAQIYTAVWPYLTDAVPHHEVDALLGGAIRLRGYDLAETDTAVALTLYWQSERPIPADFDVFVHIINQDGEIVAQADQQPLDGLTPTSLWQPGEIIRHPVTVTLPSDFAAGDYHLNVGMFLRETGERLEAVGGDSEVDLIRLTSLRRE